MFNAVQKENQPLAERVAEQIAQLIQERELKGRRPACPMNLIWRRSLGLDEVRYERL